MFKIIHAFSQSNDVLTPHRAILRKKLKGKFEGISQNRPRPRQEQLFWKTKSKASMQDSVHQEEKARLLIAYDSVYNLFTRALQDHAHVGLQREHLLMAIVLQATEEEQNLLYNVLSTRGDLVNYYNSATQMVETFEDQNMPAPPAPPGEYADADVDLQQDGGEDFEPYTPVQARATDIAPSVQEKPEMSSHMAAYQEKMRLQAEKKSESKPSSRRSSLRSFFNFGKSKPAKTRSRKGSLRNDAYTTAAIKINVENNVEGYSVQVPVRLLDGQMERITCDVNTTAGDALDSFVSNLGISVPDINQCLALFENHTSTFNRLQPTQKLLEVVASWYGEQDHLEDEGHKLIVRRTTYRPNDSLDSLASSAISAADGALRLAYSDCVYHYTRGLYRLDQNHVPKMAASILFCENDGKPAKKLRMGLTKQIKTKKMNIFPPEMQLPTSKQLKNLTKGIKSFYSSVQGLVEVYMVMLDVIKLCKSNCKEEYGARFFPVRVVLDPHEGKKTSAVCGVNWAGVSFASFSRKGACLGVVRETFDEILSTGMTKDQETQQYVLTLVHNPKMHGDDIQVIADDCVEIQKVIESFIRKEPAPKAKSKGRRPSMADSVRRSSVSMNTNSILEDMADAFGDWDFDEGAENNTIAEEEEEEVGEQYPRNDEEEEVWSPHKDPNSNSTYFFNNETQETTWENPNADYDVVDDETSGKQFFVHKQSRRTSWMVPSSMTY
jgi:hypothetical protein